MNLVCGLMEPVTVQNDTPFGVAVAADSTCALTALRSSAASDAHECTGCVTCAARALGSAAVRAGGSGRTRDEQAGGDSEGDAAPATESWCRYTRCA